MSTAARILLVEDEMIISTFVRRFLTSIGYEVDVTETGEAALEQALTQEYGLIICDMHLSQMDGATLYGKLHPERPALRWLVLTGDSLSERSRVFLDRNGLPVLFKPFTLDELQGHVQRILGTS
jgi:DNA-binding response OmpR family regulator